MRGGLPGKVCAFAVVLANNILATLSLPDFNEKLVSSNFNPGFIILN
jgi:hypothetical protein